MKRLLKKIIPKPVRHFIFKVFRSKLHAKAVLRYQYNRYAKYNLSLSATNKVVIESRVVLLTHVIQKGFTHCDIKPYFGIDVVTSLLGLIPRLEKEQPDSFILQESIETLAYYYLYHKEQNITPHNIFESLSFFISHRISNIDSRNSSEFIDSVIGLNSATSDLCTDLERHSCRHFDIFRGISDATLLMAIKKAQSAPSACNLQSIRIHCYKTSQQITNIVNVQLGMRGFENNIPLLFIVTSNVGVYPGPRCINLCYVDGGIFAMSLMNSLLEHGIVSCPLHWAMLPNQDRKLRRTASIPEEEEIIMLLAAGYPAENSTYAKSGRRNPEDILVLHPGEKE